MGGMACWKAVKTEQAMTECLWRGIALWQATTLAELRSDQLSKISGGLKRVVLAEVNPVDAIFVEPVLNSIRNLGRCASDEKAALFKTGNLVQRATDCLIGAKSTSHVSKRTP